MNIVASTHDHDPTKAGPYTLTFRVTTSLQDELDGFVRYNRLGLFQKAQEIYEDVLDHQFDTLFPVTAELADSLLEQGDFRRLAALLEGRLRQATELGYDDDQVGLLRLLKALVDLHRHGDLRNSLEVARSWREAATASMSPDTLSIVDKLSLVAYLRIITIAFQTSNWLRPQDMQPPWESNGTQPWSGFYELFGAMSADPDNAWNARNIFRPLATSLTPGMVDVLYSKWRSKREQAAAEDEESLLADLSITTTYARQLIASVRGNPDHRSRDRISDLISTSQGLMSQLTTLVEEVDDVTDVRMQPALNLDLAEAEKEIAEYSNRPPWTYKSFRDKCKQLWLLARKNHDFVTQRDSIRLHQSMTDVKIKSLIDNDLRVIFSGRAENMLEYVKDMTHTILSVFQVVMRSASLQPPEEQGTNLDAAAKEDLKSKFSLLLNRAWATEIFEVWLDSNTMTTPLVLFMGSVVRLILAELADERLGLANAQERILKLSQDIQWPLHRMVDTGYLGGVQLLVQNGAPLNAKDDWETTPLMKAREGQDIAMVGLLLRSGAEINAENITTTLSWAATKGGEEVVRVLLDRGAEVDSVDINGRTPLSHAAQQGHWRAVKVLLDKGANIEAKDKDGFTPLSLAAGRGYNEVVRLFLDKGADIEAEDKDGCTPLSLAAGRGYNEVVRLFLDKGADIEAEDKDGCTPLSLAAGRGYNEVVRLFLDKGADIEAEDKDGCTPLSLAAGRGYNEVVRLFLDKGADIEAKDKDGYTPLSRAAEQRHWAVVMTLFEKGATIEPKNRDSYTPLSRAAKQGSWAVVTQFVDKGANVESKDSDGYTPLGHAASQGCGEIVRLLLDHGADANAKDGNGMTPLSLATEKGYDTLVKLLLDRGADANAKDGNGMTPLWLATEKGYDTLVKLLLDRGADANAKDGNGMTPLWLATEKGYDKLVKLLLDRGAYSDT